MLRGKFGNLTVTGGALRLRRENTPTSPTPKNMKSKLLLSSLSLSALLPLAAQDPLPDTTPPQILCPPDKVEWCLDPAGQPVYFNPPQVTDSGDPEVAAVCQPESGSHFPMGVTTVTCTALDASGNQSQCTFKVTVKEPDFGIQNQGGRLSLINECLWPVEVSNDLSSNWDPLTDPPAPQSNPRQFFRLRDPKQNPGIAFDHVDASISYVATGLMQDWYRNGEAGGGHIGSLLWAQDDLTTAGSTAVLNAPAAAPPSTITWSGVINIPFPFHFYGKSFKQCCVAWNGLLTFDTGMAGQTTPDARKDVLDGAGNVTGQTTMPLPNPRLPAYTICGFYTNAPNQGAPEQQPVRAFLLGTAPHRQVWFVYPGDQNLFPNPPHGIGSRILRRAIVLEEGTNRVLLADMFDQNHVRDLSGATGALDEDDLDDVTTSAATVIVAPDSHRYVIGIQKNSTTALSIPASPTAALNNEDTGYKDNDYYDFTPRHLASLVQGSGHPLLDDFDARVQQYMIARNWPGVTVAAAKGGRMVYNKGFGHARVYPSVPMQPTHRTCIGSTSKMFTTMALFKLIQEGRLTTADLSKHVYTENHLLNLSPVNAGFGTGIFNGNLTLGDVNRLKTVTLQHLLTHTAMIARSGDGWGTHQQLGIPYDQVTYPDGVRHFLGYNKLVTPALPGAVKSYSNQGVGQVGWLTGIVSQREYGLTYEAYMASHVLAPIGSHHMRGRTNWISEETSLDAFRYYSYTNRDTLPHADSRMTGYNGPPAYEQAWNISNAAGGWTATAADLVRLMCAQDGLGNHADLLPAPLRQLLHSRPFGNTTVDVNGNPTAAHAHGWVYDANNEILTHNGDIFYGGSILLLMPNDGAVDGVFNWNSNSIAVAVCANTGYSGSMNNMANDLRDKLKVLNFPAWYDLLGGNKAP